MEKLRIGVIGLAAAVVGFVVPGCYTPQPLPECTVTGSQGAFGILPYWGKLTKTSGTGACADLSALAVGMQVWNQPDGGPNARPYRVAIRPSRIVDMWNGEVFPPANQDPSNDCTNEEDCDICVITLGDGGLALGADDSIPVEPGVVLPDGGTEDQALLADGGTLAVDAANECGPVDEPVYPVDSNDPDGLNMTGVADFATQFPNADGVCALANFTPSKQDFDAIDIINPDGSPGQIPAMTVQYDWTEFNVISTSTVPGTAFTAKLKLTEGSCVADYDVQAFWPILGCDTDADCNPVPDADAGQIFGSGINPKFEPKCETGLQPDAQALIDYFMDNYYGYTTSGICVPSVDLTTLK